MEINEQILDHILEELEKLESIDSSLQDIYSIMKTELGSISNALNKMAWPTK